MFDADGSRRKLIIFTEHRDTLNYLVRQAAGAARPAGRGRRRSTAGCRARSAAKIQEAFTQDKDVLILVATDAAGEGINLQRAHLMVNYDLPWNPNRIEQRFGRIHRIGQTEVCHLWNLVAEDTREGQVFQRLLEKLERAAQGARRPGLRRARRGVPRPTPARPADRGDPLRRPTRREARGSGQVVDATVGDALREVVHERALVSDVMTTADVERIRERDGAGGGPQAPAALHPVLLPEAFAHLGGVVREREPGRFEITPRPGRAAPP